MKIRFYILIILVCSCATKSDVNLSDIQNELNQKFNKGKELFDKGKYTRAKNEFDYILLNDRGSDIGTQARFYQAETLYMLEQFEEAISSYEKVLQYSDDSNKIELSKFKICKCYFDLSNHHNRDQSNNDLALEKLQYFIDQYPFSSYLEKAENYIAILRNRKAEKIYQTARLYLKLKEFNSALIYFDEVLKKYYDTPIADDARISIIFLYLLRDDTNEAESYYNSNKAKFINKDKEVEANDLLYNYNDKNNWFKNFIRLYK